MSEIQSTLIETDIDYEQFGSAWEALRMMHGFTHDDMAEVTGMPPAWFELLEESYEEPNLGQLDVMAVQYECSPGELLDAMYVIAEAHTHDVQAEREDESEAERVLEFMLDNRSFITKAEFERQFGHSNINAPLNILYDRGYRFKHHRISHNRLPWAHEIESHPSG